MKLTLNIIIKMTAYRQSLNKKTLHKLERFVASSDEDGGSAH